MRKEYHFCVAGFGLSVCLPEGRDVDTLLPSFRPFRCAEGAEGEKLFDFTVSAFAEGPEDSRGKLLEEDENDMGLLRLYAVPEGYRVEVRPDSRSGVMHYILADTDFSVVRAYVHWEDKYVGQVLSSLLRVAYSQAVLFRRAVSIHASAVCCGGRAYLFMGKSGTGKSTHASLWLGHIPGSALLNDDNPTVRIVGGSVIAYGTPWSGKTPCYRNLSAPVGGMARLRQAPVNRFLPQKGVEAFVALYPGCSVINRDARLRNMLYDTLSFMAGAVPVAVLECRPDEEAARVCAEGFSAGKK